MGDIYSKNYLRVNANPAEKIPAGQANGVPFHAYDEATTTVAATAADVIRTGIIIPKGSMVRNVVVVSPANGGTVSVGIAGSANKYVNAGTAGAKTVANPLLETTVDEEIIITIGGSPSAAGTYKVSIEFVKY